MGTVAIVLRIVLRIVEDVLRRRHPEGRHVVAAHHLFVENERKQPTEILIVHVHRRVFGHVRREDRTVRTVETVALVGLVVGHVRHAVELVDEAVLCDVRAAREHRHRVFGRAVFL